MSDSLITQTPTLAKLQGPLSNALAETGPKYFYCHKLHHHMLREDGKRIIFNFGVYKAEIAQDQRYLQGEIDGGNEYIRHATTEEIEAYEDRVDFKGAMARRLRPQLEAEIASGLEQQLRATLAAKLSAAGPGLTQAQIDILTGADMAGISGVDSPTPGKSVASGTATLTMSPPGKLAGIVNSGSLANAATAGK